MGIWRDLFITPYRDEHVEKNPDDFDERFGELVSEYNTLVKDYESATNLIDRYEESLAGLSQQNNLLLKMNSDLVSALRAFSKTSEGIVGPMGPPGPSGRDKGTDV